MVCALHPSASVLINTVEAPITAAEPESRMTATFPVTASIVIVVGSITGAGNYHYP